MGGDRSPARMRGCDRAELTIADMYRITVEVARRCRKREDSVFQGPEADERRRCRETHCLVPCQRDRYVIPNDDENSYYTGPSNSWFAPMDYDAAGHPIE